MDFIYLIIAFGVLIFTFELTKHLFSKTLLKLIKITLIISSLFVFVLDNMSTKDEIKTNNKLIRTSAAVVATIKDQELFEDISIKNSWITKKIRNILKIDSEEW